MGVMGRPDGKKQPHEVKWETAVPDNIGFIRWVVVDTSAGNMDKRDRRSKWETAVPDNIGFIRWVSALLSRNGSQRFTPA